MPQPHSSAFLTINHATPRHRTEFTVEGMERVQLMVESWQLRVCNFGPLDISLRCERRALA